MRVANWARLDPADLILCDGTGDRLRHGERMSAYDFATSPTISATVATGKKLDIPADCPAAAGATSSSGTKRGNSRRTPTAMANAEYIYVSTPTTRTRIRHHAHALVADLRAAIAADEGVEGHLMQLFHDGAELSSTVPRPAWDGAGPPRRTARSHAARRRRQYRRRRHPAEDRRGPTATLPDHRGSGSSTGSDDLRERTAKRPRGPRLRSSLRRMGDAGRPDAKWHDGRQPDPGGRGDGRAKRHVHLTSIGKQLHDDDSTLRDHGVGHEDAVSVRALTGAAAAATARRGTTPGPTEMGQGPSSMSTADDQPATAERHRRRRRRRPGLPGGGRLLHGAPGLHRGAAGAAFDDDQEHGQRSALPLVTSIMTTPKDQSSSPPATTPRATGPTCPP